MPYVQCCLFVCLFVLACVTVHACILFIAVTVPTPILTSAMSCIYPCFDRSPV
jgi:hypothetical protein